MEIFYPLMRTLAVIGLCILPMIMDYIMRDEYSKKLMMTKKHYTVYQFVLCCICFYSIFKIVE